MMADINQTDMEGEVYDKAKHKLPNKIKTELVRNYNDAEEQNPKFRFESDLWDSFRDEQVSKYEDKYHKNIMIWLHWKYKVKKKPFMGSGHKDGGDVVLDNEVSDDEREGPSGLGEGTGRSKRRPGRNDPSQLANGIKGARKAMKRGITSLEMSANKLVKQIDEFKKRTNVEAPRSYDIDLTDDQRDIINQSEAETRIALENLIERIHSERTVKRAAGMRDSSEETNFLGLLNKGTKNDLPFTVYTGGSSGCKYAEEVYKACLGPMENNGQPTDMGSGI